MNELCYKVSSVCISLDTGSPFSPIQNEFDNSNACDDSKNNYRSVDRTCGMMLKRLFSKATESLKQSEGKL